MTAKGAVTETARSAFEIADDTAGARFGRGLKGIAARAKDPLRSLAQAHYALREGWLDRAREFAEAVSALAPDDPEVSLLLRYLDSRLPLLGVGGDSAEIRDLRLSAAPPPTPSGG